MKQVDLTADKQMAMLADRYSQRADAYDGLWSPIIRPAGERLIAHLPLSSTTKYVIDIGTGAGALLPAIERSAPSAVIVGVDRLRACCAWPKRSTQSLWHSWMCRSWPYLPTVLR